MKRPPSERITHPARNRSPDSRPDLYPWRGAWPSRWKQWPRGRTACRSQLRGSDGLNRLPVHFWRAGDRCQKPIRRTPGDLNTVRVYQLQVYCMLSGSEPSSVGTEGASRNSNRSSSKATLCEAGPCSTRTTRPMHSRQRRGRLALPGSSTITRAVPPSSSKDCMNSRCSKVASRPFRLIFRVMPGSSSSAWDGGAT